ncbi:MAG TPA: transposase [Oleiagrimonas sp.]|nr:transposase [Oleiagrimonas sp.]
MPNYRPATIPGATYFFTVVTARHRRILATPRAVRAMRESIATVMWSHPFSIDAWVVLPDHMHAIWTLPPDDDDYSARWSRIKAGFTKRCGLLHQLFRKGQVGLWQPRFWEHAIRDEDDWKAHLDYLHYNPVKHGLVERVADWPYSSFNRCVERGWYTEDWGECEPVAPVAACGE